MKLKEEPKGHMKEQNRRPKKSVRSAMVRTTASAFRPKEKNNRRTDGPAWHIGRVSRNLAEHKKTTAPRTTVRAERRSLKPHTHR